MLEDLLDGTEQIEEKYLHNFSKTEKVLFGHWIDAWVRHMARYQVHLDAMIYEEKSEPFINWSRDPVGSCSLAIKYALNQVAADDPKMRAFELGLEDGILKPDRLALDIAKAFQNNTQCKTVVLDRVGLTDNGMLPILSVLKDKELHELDIRNNKITDTSYQVLDDILSNPKTRWSHVELGVTEMTPERAKSLSGHKNISFKAVEPRTGLLNLILPSKRRSVRSGRG